MDELARAAGLSRTAFYFYFPGKEQAMMSAANEVTAELTTGGHLVARRGPSR